MLFYINSFSGFLFGTEFVENTNPDQNFDLLTSNYFSIQHKINIFSDFCKELDRKTVIQNFYLLTF